MFNQLGDVRARRAAIGDALVQHDRGVGAAAAGEVRDRRDEGVHEAARREARLLRVEVHLVADGASLGAAVHPPLGPHHPLGAAGERQKRHRELVDHRARRLRGVAPRGEAR